MADDARTFTRDCRLARARINRALPSAGWPKGNDD
jgi:hypothetical protein